MGIRFLVLPGILFFLSVACSSPQPDQTTPQQEFRPTATIKDIMDSIVDPNADALWTAVSATVDATGTHEIYPRTDEEWKMARRNAISLIEATNLLLISGRQVAKPHEKSENPGIELEPEEMEKLINQDRPTFYKLAHGLHDTVMDALKAIDNKDKDALLESGDAIDRACENCHMKYWYPNEAQNQRTP